MAGERHTAIHLPGCTCPGFMDYGNLSPEKMIAEYRKMAMDRKREAEEILAAALGDFHVSQFNGRYVQRNRKTLQSGRKVEQV